MKRLWTMIDDQNWKAQTKYKAAFFIFGLLLALLGCIVWLCIRSFALSTTDWLICFAGYPFLIGCLIVFLYSCRHEFHNGPHSDFS
ncbi:MAG: hypothetical protein Q4B59_01535 [Lachnospiraceae bacterium]|nr:hypothetical protein [Lachnospiraceae bacterium]